MRHRKMKSGGEYKNRYLSFAQKMTRYRYVLFRSSMFKYTFRQLNGDDDSSSWLFRGGAFKILSSITTVVVLVSVSLRCPPERSFSCQFFGSDHKGQVIGPGCPNTSKTGVLRFSGHVEQGFENVNSEFKRSVFEGREVGAQVAVLWQGRFVVDLAGGLASKAPHTVMTADHLVQVFGSSQVVESTVVSMLVDRKLLEYDAPISRYWPEFKSYGKEGIKVATLMRHQAGLMTLGHSTYEGHQRNTSPRRLTRLELQNHSSMSRLLADQQPSWVVAGANKEQATNRRQAYHAYTRGWYLDQLVQRVDPQVFSRGVQE
jgi:hypothetical protein